MLLCLGFFIKVRVDKDQIQSKIQFLKSQLADSRGFDEEKTRLGELRKRLEGEIAALENEVSASHFKPGEFESKKSLIAACQEKMLEIDHILDDLEEWTDEKKDAVEKELISLILKLHPEELKDYEDYASRLHYAQATQRQARGIVAHLDAMIDALELIQSKRMEVKRRGVLSYILGPSPNLVIGRCLKKVCDEAEACLALAPQNESLKDELNKLIQHCKGRWGFRTVDKIFVPIKENLIQYRESFQAEEEGRKAESSKIEEDIKDWIERLSK